MQVKVVNITVYAQIVTADADKFTLVLQHDSNDDRILEQVCESISNHYSDYFDTNEWLLGTQFNYEVIELPIL